MAASVLEQRARDLFSDVFGDDRGSGHHELEEQEERPRPAQPDDAGFSRDGYELPVGGVIEWPETTGRIRVRDSEGEMREFYDIADSEWARFAAIFGVRSSDFDEEEE